MFFMFYTQLILHCNPIPNQQQIVSKEFLFYIYYISPCKCKLSLRDVITYSVSESIYSIKNKSITSGYTLLNKQLCDISRHAHSQAFHNDLQ